MSYEVSTEVYEGPLDVLLRLIVADEVDLYRISLVELVDAFLAEMERIFAASRTAEAGGAAPLDLDTSTEFLLVAATLIELKTRRLLPDADDGDLDEELAAVGGARSAAAPSPRVHDVQGGSRRRCGASWSGRR